MSGADEELSLHALFRAEVESHAAILGDGLAGLEAGASAAAIEPLMRAAHSLKGAARVVGLDAAVRIAHAMEDGLVAAQEGRLALSPAAVDLLLRGLDWIVAMSAETEEALPAWLIAQAEAGEALERDLGRIGELAAAPSPPPAATSAAPHAVVETRAATESDEQRAVKVSADALSRLTGLAAESLVEARRFEPLAASLQQIKARQGDVADILERLRDALGAGARDRAVRLAADLEHALDDCRQALAARTADIDALSRESATLATRLYDHVVASRMRPFGDVTQGMTRLVRDTARALGKRVRLDIDGRATAVDREILEQLDAPLTHLLRNAIDHGLEGPAQRAAAGKSEEGRIVVEAGHRGGMLVVAVRDDGAGIDPAAVRQRVVERGLAGAAIADQLDDAELFQFLLLPGFTTRDRVSETSGRGVGLDAVQAMVHAVGGGLRIASVPGAGTEFELRLPVTRSVLRALVVEIAGEPYAVPLARAARVLAIDPGALRTVEGRTYLDVDDERVALVPARAVLELEPLASPAPATGAIAAVVIGDRGQRFALEVDRLAGECDLVVRPLDPRLGKVPDIAAASTLADGRPALILDVDDLVRSIDTLVGDGGLRRTRREGAGAPAETRRRVLVIDDSLTVRELERRLLEGQGYAVDVAVDGMEGWNALRLGAYDLVVTDVDMPRLNGIDLVRRIKADPRLRALPVIIVSYKDRDEDRLRGLEVGADHYLTKSSFQDETLARVVRDLVGGPTR